MRGHPVTRGHTDERTLCDQVDTTMRGHTLMRGHPVIRGHSDERTPGDERTL